MKYIRKWSKFVVLFLFCFLVCIFTYSFISGDVIWNYGFSYAISRGQIPYVDFNMIVPPFSPFLYLIPFLFSKSYVVYLLFHSILFVVLFYFLEKLFGNKAYLLLFFFIFPFPVGNAIIMYPGYNFILIMLLVIILYLEKTKKNDFLIGMLLALCVFTKQSVGIVLLLPSICFLFKDKRRLFRRFLGFFSVCFIFLFFFLISGNFLEFLNHCLFGLFDFSKSNTRIFFSNYYFWLWLLLVFILIFLLIKRRNKMFISYLLCFSVISIPTFERYHINLFLFVFLFVIIEVFPFNNKYLFPWCFIMVLFIYLLTMAVVLRFQLPKFESFPNLGVIRMNVGVKNQIKLLNKYLKRYDKSDIIFLTGDAYFYKVINGMDITHYDLLNYGNHGYHGTKKITNQIRIDKDKIFIINCNEYQNDDDTSQFNIDVIDYVLRNYQMIDKVGDYEIYQKVS